jgi:tellurite resistance protein TehA-like permease
MGSRPLAKRSTSSILWSFTLIICTITLRFVKYLGSLKGFVTHPTEGLFLATSMLSQASIIAAIARCRIPSCGPWLALVYHVLFWIYFAVSFLPSRRAVYATIYLAVAQDTRYGPGV